MLAYASHYCRPITRTIVVLVLVLGVVVALIPGPTSALAQDGDAPLPTCPGIGYPCILGKEDWYSVGDKLQFIGDSNYSTQTAGSCEDCWDLWDSCLVDNGFLFRKVTNFNGSTCTYTPSSTCDIVRTVCCYFWTGAPCGNCTAACKPCDMCMSIWEVISYTPDGNTGRGCYKLEFVSDCPVGDCLHGNPGCSYRTWDQ